MSNTSAILKLEKNFNYQGWPNCIRLHNGRVELILATDIGLRILHFGFIGGKNLFYLSPEDRGKQGGDQWRIYGGHRLWHAPEAIPRTYEPDNAPVDSQWDGDRLILTQNRESNTGIVKQMEIRLFPNQNRVQIRHRLINQNEWPVQLSVWAISVMAPGGKAIVPQEPFGEGDAFLLPARSLSLWSYTRMNDPRWNWGDRYILAFQDSNLTSEQKMGVLNKQGWVAYSLDDDMLIKIFEVNPEGSYPDYGSNNEIYINGKFLEVETLGVYQEIPPSGSAEHTEEWMITKGVVLNNEASVEEVLLPEIAAFRQLITEKK